MTSSPRTCSVQLWSRWNELRNPYDLRMTARVNGETWTEGSTSDMHGRFEQMIAYASRDEPVRVGEVFGSGTVGNGSGAEQGRWLEAGDVVELAVDGIGILRNRVVAGREHRRARRDDLENRSSRQARRSREPIRYPPLTSEDRNDTL
jgi:2-keto-4-pentenoate hydratase/2-oxohepta-3-ene-1,7-dioic acid hydratase in catechol pathway